MLQPWTSQSSWIYRGGSSPAAVLSFTLKAGLGPEQAAIRAAPGLEPYWVLHVQLICRFPCDKGFEITQDLSPKSCSPESF